MPKIVFFGDNVNRQLVEFLYKKVEESDAVLVLGSSLQVSAISVPHVLFGLDAHPLSIQYEL